ncbi:MAG: hypothetical protein JNL98_32845 [Bryobacterales bacterium]|nr:hypothetical protein [Bryobacterales bacterium]
MLRLIVLLCSMGLGCAQDATDDPQVAFWRMLHRELAGSRGDVYFDNMRGAHLPGIISDGALRYTQFKGFLISQEPAENPQKLLIGVRSAREPEITLRLSQPLQGRAAPGTILEFEGVAVEFTREPFNLVLNTTRHEITGWPKLEDQPKKSDGKKKKR